MSHSLAERSEFELPELVSKFEKPQPARIVCHASAKSFRYQLCAQGDVLSVTCSISTLGDWGARRQFTADGW
jgi:hypothetical protein